MTPLIATTNTLFALGTVGLELCALVLIIMMLGRDRGLLSRWLAHHALVLTFLIAAGMAVGSLVYSEIIGFTPCLLCWWQRIFIYPTAVVTLVGLTKKRGVEALTYAFPLACLGTLVALWHVIEKMIGKEVISCGADSPSCLQMLVHKFGYIDIPVMSLSGLLLIVLLIANQRRFR